MDTRSCKSCSTEFIIEPEDLSFYAKIQVPPPTRCPLCRQRRRYAWRNERTLYRRNCDLCGKSSVSIYNPKSIFKVYCPNCWFGDGWDAGLYERDFDFSKSFFDQFRELQREVPRVALLSKNGVRSDYVNHANNNRDCYLSVSVFDSENVLYSNIIWHGARDSMDCYHLDHGNDLMYESLDCEHCYNCQFLFFARSVRDSYYSYDLKGCSSCFLCSNLRQKQYCFRNEQLTKEDYEKKLRSIDLGSFRVREELYKEWKEMMSQKSLHKYANLENCVNVTGHMVLDSRNASFAFDGDKMEDVKYCIVTTECKDSMDLYHVGFESELMYESHALIHTNRVFFSHLSYHDNDLYYCDSCHNSSNLFGCVGLRKREYCIFNKQYEKGEYENQKNRIVEYMKTIDEFGEFFPPRLSPFGYNETVGNVYMPMSKEKALEAGYGWTDELPGTFNKETLAPEELKDSITAIEDGVCSEVLRCAECGRNYNIVKSELDLYRRFQAPIPRLCPNCRYVRRVGLRNPRTLYKRQCNCSVSSHAHGPGPCPIEFETSYAPDRPELVYCEACYLNEVQ